MSTLKQTTVNAIARVFEQLDYPGLGKIYCDEGGDAFWAERRGPAQELGTALAEVLLDRLRPTGRSLYVGAGVSEIPVLVAETLELHRDVVATNLRAQEVMVLNEACRELPVMLRAEDARIASGTFDHLWLVSVLNDPECFPELGALSSGWANPVTFDPDAFVIERRAVAALTAECLKKLALPGLVTTSVEEIPWITDWCTAHGVSFVVEDKDYPTAIVGDPICFIRVGEGRG